MKTYRAGKSDMMISEIVLGCWVMGGERWGGADDDESIRAIHTAMDLGMNTLDTAEAYNSGYSERIIGRAIQNRKNDYVISSKVANSHYRHDAVIAACEASLKNMGRDYLDIYFLHWRSGYLGDPLVPLEETMGAMAQLKKEGKIRAIGLSNFTKEDFEEAKQYARVDLYQPPYSLLWRRADRVMLPYCKENDIAVIPYSPIGQGLLTGKFTMESTFPKGDGRGHTPLFQPANRKRALEMLEKLKPIAQKYGKTLAQLAIHWLMQQDGITAPIVGGRTSAQVTENAGAAGWQLDQADFDTIDGLSKAFWAEMPNYADYFDTSIVDNPIL